MRQQGDIQRGPRSKTYRQEAIRRVLRRHRVQTQEELADLLARDEGIEATQATLSRDLAQIGALRVSRPDGGSVYELEAMNAQAAPLLRELGENVLSMAENGALVVLRTRPGMASALALAIDGARLPECLGTLAGDDTIFATPTRHVSTRRLASQIRSLFGREIP